MKNTKQVGYSLSPEAVRVTREALQACSIMLAQHDHYLNGGAEYGRASMRGDSSMASSMKLRDPYADLCGFNALSNASSVSDFLSRRFSGWDTSRIR